MSIGLGQTPGEAEMRKWGQSLRAGTVPAVIVVSSLMVTGIAAAAESTNFAEKCSALAGYTSGTLVVTEAREVPAGPAPRSPLSPNGNSGAVVHTLPGHCIVKAEIDRRTGVDGVPYAIKMELRIPVEWNGRFMYQGGGGMNGFVLPAIGSMVAGSAALPPGLGRGFAVVSTDSGHVAKGLDDASFAKDQEAKLNYAYASIGKVTSAAKSLIATLTGRAPDRSYFMGCSNGGREAMIAAQRFPSEFEGILATNPAFNLRNAAILSHYSASVYAAAAAQDPAARSEAARLFTASDSKLLKAAIVRSCDDLDGAKDGLIFNHAACRVDVQSLTCKRDQTAECLSAEKVGAVEKAFRGPLDDAGQPLLGSWPFDSGNFEPSWLTWQTGVVGPNGTPMTMLRDLVASSLTRYFAFPPYTAKLTGSDEEIKQLLKSSNATAAITDATSTEFTTFQARGGKMMLVTGWSDPIFSASDLARWYGEMSTDMQRATGKDPTEFARLFLVPSLSHCSGGLDDFDAITSLVDWVEKGSAPDAFVAKGSAFPGLSRPICAYPKAARYSGSGPLEAAESYRCE